MTTSKQRLMEFGKSVLIVGISGAASVAVTDYALDRYTDWCGVKRGVVQGLGHIALGAVIAAAGAPAVGAGVAVGGVVSGMEDVIAWVRMSEAERATATSAARARLAAYRNQPSSTTAPPAGSSTGLLPEGMRAPEYGGQRQYTGSSVG